MAEHEWTPPENVCEVCGDCFNDTCRRHYIPAPAWRPIAELPDAWRDGRWVVLSIGWSPSICLFSGGRWKFLDGRWIEPTHYLDLAIPEVPHG